MNLYAEQGNKHKEMSSNEPKVRKRIEFWSQSAAQQKFVVNPWPRLPLIKGPKNRDTGIEQDRSHGHFADDHHGVPGLWFR
jgi:hypothetical protein